MIESLAVRSLAWLTRNFHDLPGRWRLLRWLEGHANLLATLPARTVRFGRGGRICVAPVDENGRRVYLRGFDRRERLTRHFVRLLRPGDCVIDVGANVGYYTLVAAELVGPTGRVYAFDPSPQVLPYLRANAVLNPQAPIGVHGVAVTDRCGETVFYGAAAERSGYSSIRDLGDQKCSVTRVSTVSLDSLLDELPAVRLVKIDVEGAELLVLEGMRRLIARDRPFIICEVDDGFLRQLGGDAATLCACLGDCGYELHRIVAGGELVPLVQPPDDRCNLLATPRTVDGLAASR